MDRVPDEMIARQFEPATAQQFQAFDFRHRGRPNPELAVGVFGEKRPVAADSQATGFVGGCQGIESALPGVVFAG
jgi:hypothetical protein